MLSSNFMTTNSPYHIKIGVIWAVYVSGGYSIKQLCLLLNKRLTLLKIPVDKQIPIVSEHLHLTQSVYEQRVWTFLGRVWSISCLAVLKILAVVGKKPVLPCFPVLYM